MFSKFLLGDLVIDDSVKRVCGRTPLDLIARHAVCEFGLVTPRQHKINLQALEEVDEITSEYRVDHTTEELGRIRVTTCQGWNKTRVTWVKPAPKPKRKKDVIPF